MRAGLFFVSRLATQGLKGGLRHLVPSIGVFQLTDQIQFDGLIQMPRDCTVSGLRLVDEQSLYVEGSHLNFHG